VSNVAASNEEWRSEARRLREQREEWRLQAIQYQRLFEGQRDELKKHRSRIRELKAALLTALRADLKSEKALHDDAERILMKADGI
jgi:chromosome segregation ATPase